MKQIIYLIIGLLIILGVSAINQPNQVSTGVLYSVSQPVSPNTGTEGECTPYDITNRVCEGNVAHYDQCTMSVSGGVWKHFSTNCEEYEKVCSLGECVNPNDVVLGLNWKVWLIIGLIILLFLLWRGK